MYSFLAQDNIQHKLLHGRFELSVPPEVNAGIDGRVAVAHEQRQVVDCVKVWGETTHGEAGLADDHQVDDEGDHRSPAEQEAGDDQCKRLGNLPVVRDAILLLLARLHVSLSWEDLGLVTYETPRAFVANHDNYNHNIGTQDQDAIICIHCDITEQQQSERDWEEPREGNHEPQLLVCHEEVIVGQLDKM